ncbi:MAG: VanZ family protein [Bacteroidota bacterium]
MFFKHTKWSMLWALIILILCGIPGKDIPHISFLELLSFDKFVHAGIFFGLILLTIRGFLLQTKFAALQKNAKLIAFVICVIYGGSLEIMQGTLFEDRSASLADFIANSFGSAVGLITYQWMEKHFLSKLIR